ncbi:unnamed protein product, partial [Symbiodinium sp. CCMP2456]
MVVAVAGTVVDAASSSADVVAGSSNDAEDVTSALSSTPSSGSGAVSGTMPRESRPDSQDGVSFVQRLQPDEAQTLANMGVRRDTITALGRFLGELARAGEGHATGDVARGDVEWAMRVVDLAMQRCIEVQDVINSLLIRRLQGGDCVLPDADSRGGVCQVGHPFVVALARTYLDGLREALADAWVDPDTLPEELRRFPPNQEYFASDNDEEGGYGDGLGGNSAVPVDRDQARASTDPAPRRARSRSARRDDTGRDVHVETVAAVPAGTAVSTLTDDAAVPGDTTDGVVPVAGPPPVGGTDVDNTVDVETQSLMQRMPVLSDPERDQLLQSGWTHDSIGELGALLDRMHEDALGCTHSERVWMLGVVRSFVHGQQEMSRAFGSVLGLRAVLVDGAPAPLPPAETRSAFVAGCGRLFRAMHMAHWRRVVDLMDDVVLYPELLPVELQGTVGSQNMTSQGSGDVSRRVADGGQPSPGAMGGPPDGDPLAVCPHDPSGICHGAQQHEAAVGVSIDAVFSGLQDVSPLPPGCDASLEIRASDPLGCDADGDASDVSLHSGDEGAGNVLALHELGVDTVDERASAVAKAAESLARRLDDAEQAVRGACRGSLRKLDVGTALRSSEPALRGWAAEVVAGRGADASVYGEVMAKLLSDESK